MEVGKISVGIEASLGKLDAGLRTAENHTKESAKRMGATMVADGPFGGAFVRGAAKAFVGLKALQTGFTAISAASQALRGDTEAAWQTIGRVPILGPLITSFKEMADELTGAAESSRKMAESEERVAEAIKRILELRKQQALLDAQLKGGDDERKRIKLQIEGGGSVAEIKNRLSELRTELARAAELVTETASAGIGAPGITTTRERDAELAEQLRTEIRQAEAELANTRKRNATEQVITDKKNADELAEKEAESLRKLAELKRKLQDEDLRRAEENIRKEAEAREAAMRKVDKQLEDFFGFEDKYDRIKDKLDDFFGDVENTDPNQERREKMGLLESFIGDSDRRPRQFGQEIFAGRTAFNTGGQQRADPLVRRAEQQLEVMKRIEANTRRDEVRRVLGADR